MSNVLTRDQILGADDLKRECIPVPEWGGDVCIRVMTGAELVEVGKKGDMEGAALLALLLCDDAGKAIFSESDIASLNKKNGAVIVRLTKEALKINGLTDDAVKEIEKN